MIEKFIPNRNRSHHRIAGGVDHRNAVGTGVRDVQGGGAAMAVSIPVTGSMVYPIFPVKDPTSGGSPA
jgi:hypothetical protein